MSEYQFTTDWFSHHSQLWEMLLAALKPQKILEIGAFEGRATTYMIHQIGDHVPMEIYCVDTWEGGQEHRGIDFSLVEQRFGANCELATRNVKHPVKIHKVKDVSAVGLSKLIAMGIKDFDLVYVDGSHVASDVFLDAGMAFYLTRVGGCIIFDDFRQDDENPYDYPKIAIKAFVNVYNNKLKHLSFRDKDGEIPLEKLYQRYYWKTAA